LEFLPVAKQKILIIGDNLSSLNLTLDTSIAFCEAALNLKFEVFWCEKKDISFFNYEIIINKIFHIQHASIKSIDYQEFLPKHKTAIHFSEFTYCFVRSHPPFDESYKDLCWILNTQKKVKIINSPSALLNFHEKSFHMRALEEGVLKKKNFVPTCLSDSIEIVETFLKEQTETGIQQFVTKPWLGYGGAEVKLWNKHDQVLDIVKNSPEKVLVQPLLENIHTDGDRRVLIVNGKVSCSFVRLPRENSIIANMAYGAYSVLRDMTPEQTQLCDNLAKFIYQHSVAFAGVDLIGDIVSEINITSPTGFRTYEQLTDTKIVQNVFDALINKSS